LGIGVNIYGRERERAKNVRGRVVVRIFGGGRILCKLEFFGKGYFLYFCLQSDLAIVNSRTSNIK